MNTVHIRPASLQDMPAVLGLIQALADFEKEPDAVEITVEDLRRDGFSASPKFACLVAEKKDRIIGMALYYPRYSTWKGATFHLEDLIVLPSERGQGVGSALYRAFIKQAFEAGVKRIEWVVLDWNTPAVTFYEKSGAAVLTDWRTVQMTQAEMKAFLEKKQTN